MRLFRRRTIREMANSAAQALVWRASGRRVALVALADAVENDDGRCSIQIAGKNDADKFRCAEIILEMLLDGFVNAEPEKKELPPHHGFLVVGLDENLNPHKVMPTITAVTTMKGIVGSSDPEELYQKIKRQIFGDSDESPTT